MKKLYLSIITLALCLVLLISAFFIVPKATQAKAPYTPITVTSPDQCTPIQAGATNPPTDYQTCIVAVSIKKDYSKGVHFNVSVFGKFCYYTCSTSSLGMSYAMPEGNSVTQAVYPIHVLLVVPYYEIHGIFTMTFIFQGPSNSVSIQMVARNNAG